MPSRTFLKTAAVLALTGAAATARATDPAPDSLSTELNRRLTDEVSPLFTTYCIECHHGPKAKGDVHLDDIKSLQAALELAPDLRRITEVVSTSEMPPKKKPQPTDAERAIITQWTTAALDFVPADAPIDPNRAVNRVRESGVLTAGVGPFLSGVEPVSGQTQDMRSVLGFLENQHQGRAVVGSRFTAPPRPLPADAPPPGGRGRKTRKHRSRHRRSRRQRR